MTTINNQTALDAWNKMTTAQQQNYWTSATDENRNVLSAAGIKFTPPATGAAGVPVYQPEAKWIDPQGREVAESAYQAHIKAGNDVSAWKPISGPGSAAESVATTMTPSEATSVPGETSPAAIDVIQENADVQFAKNKELQANLEQAKLKLDAQFATIQDKFTEAQQASLSRINEMEANWMENYNKMNQLNEEFYITQNKALDERVGGQQAGIAAELSGKGIASGVIGNVVGQAQEAALSQYAALKESNINSLRTLNQEYLNFFKDVEATKKTWSDEEIALIKEKFAYAKELIDAGKAINQESITATYAPQEAMVSAKVEGVTDVLKYQAQDETKINRYAESDAAERKVMLLGMLGLTSNDIMAGQSSRFDIALLDKAVQAKDLGTAIQRLAQASQAAASSTSSTAGSSRIVPAVNKSSGTSTSTNTNDVASIVGTDGSTIGGTTTNSDAANAALAGGAAGLTSPTNTGSGYSGLYADDKGVIGAGWSTLSKVLSQPHTPQSVGSLPVAVSYAQSALKTAEAEYANAKTADQRTVASQKITKAKTDLTNTQAKLAAITNNNAKANVVYNIKYYYGAIESSMKKRAAYLKAGETAAAQEEQKKMAQFAGKLNSLMTRYQQY